MVVSYVLQKSISQLQQYPYILSPMKCTLLWTDVMYDIITFYTLELFIFGIFLGVILSGQFCSWKVGTVLIEVTGHFVQQSYKGQFTTLTSIYIILYLLCLYVQDCRQISSLYSTCLYEAAWSRFVSSHFA